MAVYAQDPKCDGVRSCYQSSRGVRSRTEIIDLRKLSLPFCNGGDDYSDYPDVAKMQQTVKSAAGLILATPEYHGSVSGVMKNALDLMSFEELSGKVAG